MIATLKSKVNFGEKNYINIVIKKTIEMEQKCA